MRLSGVLNFYRRKKLHSLEQGIGTLGRDCASAAQRYSKRA